MISQLLAVWGTILGAIVAIFLTVIVTVDTLIGDLRVKLADIENTAKADLSNLIELIEKTSWGKLVHGEVDANHNALKYLKDVVSTVPATAISRPDIWRHLSQYLIGTYQTITNQTFPIKITEALENPYRMDIFLREAIAISSTPETDHNAIFFITFFLQSSLHKYLQPNSEHKRLRNRLRSLKKVKKILSGYFIFSVFIIICCLGALILLMHDQIYWSYSLSLASITAFILSLPVVVYYGSFTRNGNKCKICYGVACLVCIFLVAYIYPVIMILPEKNKLIASENKVDYSNIPDWYVLFKTKAQSVAPVEVSKKNNADDKLDKNNLRSPDKKKKQSKPNVEKDNKTSNPPDQKQK